jgi:LDH2 family malate/lactate/ureidoglycolate dehydrogenase
VTTSRETVLVGADVLTAFIESVFVAVGMGDGDAALAADALVRTEMRGVVTHGVRQLPRYVRAIQDGGVNPRATFDIVRDTVGTATVEANAGLGHVVATKSVLLAMSKARTTGVGVVLVRNSSHLGAPGHYAQMAADADMVAMVYSTTPRAMKAPGSKRAVVGSSPIAYAFPSDGAPFLLDVSMSVVSGNRINMARERHESIPEGWMIGPDGLPSTHPEQFRDGGALVPIGDHKGFGLAAFTELLAGALAGLDWDDSPELKTHQPGGPYFADLVPSDPWNSGHAFIVLDVKAFLDPGELRRRAERLRAAMKDQDPAAGSPGVRLPGERAALAEAAARASGVTLSVSTWASLRRLAEEVGVPITPATDR